MSLGKLKDHFIFTVESVGQIPAPQIFAQVICLFLVGILLLTPSGGCGDAEQVSSCEEEPRGPDGEEDGSSGIYESLGLIMCFMGLQVKSGEDEAEPMEVDG